ncbi:MAG: hypothetical protein ACE366_18110 [Bradymonadia bacterium]
MHQLPEFPMQSVKADQAEKMKLYAGPNGEIEKFSVYVKAEAVPQWAHDMADKEIGKGEASSFEVEHYADGKQTYEITRKIDGVKTEISFSTDKSINYVEKAIDCSATPEKVQAAAKAVAGFNLEECESKKTGDMMAYEVEGKLNGMGHSFEFKADGTLVTRRKTIMGKMEVRY